MRAAEPGTDTPIITLRQVGEALYGPQWQSPLARDLGVGLRRVQRWAAGTTVPPGIWPEMFRLLSARESTIQALLRTRSGE